MRVKSITTMCVMGLFFCSSLQAEKIEGVKIDAIHKTISTEKAWGVKGRTYVHTTPIATVPPATPVNYDCSGLEFDTSLSSFESLYAVALSAHATGRKVSIDYDGAFGIGTSCRITGIYTN